MQVVVKPAWILPGLLAACATATTPDVSAWQGSFNASHALGALEGSVAVLSKVDRLDASIQINNAPADANLTWQIRNGSCAQPGDLVGGRAVYPTLNTDSLGSASAETVINATLDANGHYQASVFDAASAVLACADLEHQ